MIKMNINKNPKNTTKQTGGTNNSKTNNRGTKQTIQTKKRKT